MAASSPVPAKSALLRVLGVGFGIAVILGGTIGVGILRLPATVATQIPNYWLILLVWLLGGAYALLGSISIAELGTTLPQAGGFYVYARRAFGGYAGFAAGWGDWLNNCASLALGAITIGEYGIALFPGISAMGSKTISLGVLLFFAILQWLGLRLSSVTQKITSSATAAAFAVLIIACLFHPGVNSATSAWEQPPQPGMAFFAAMLIALRAVIVAYDGWYEAIYFTEEDVNPAHNFPRIMIGGVASIIVIYLAVNLALLHVLPIAQIAASKLPAADAAQVIFGRASERLILILSLLTLLSFINSVLLGATRIVFAIGRDGLLPARVASVSTTGSPRYALTLTATVSIVMVATGTFDRIIAIAAFFFVANYAVSYLALFVLRSREPELPRPFRAWGYPWTPLIVLLGSFGILSAAIVSDTTNSLYALAILAVSIPIYFVTVSRQRKTMRE
jgi:APA family basic amino acid/polyamine antiporter